MASGAVGSVGSVALWGSFHDLSSQKHVILSGMKWKWYDDLQTDEISFHRISRCFLFRRDLHVLLTPRQRRQLQVESQEASQWIRWLGWWVVQLQVPQNLQRFHTPPDMHSLWGILDRCWIVMLSLGFQSLKDPTVQQKVETMGVNSELVGIFRVWLLDLKWSSCLLPCLCWISHSA